MMYPNGHINNHAHSPTCLHSLSCTVYTFFFNLDVATKHNISATGSNSQTNNYTTLEPPHTPPAIDVEAQKCAPCLINIVGGASHQQTMLPRHGGTFLLLLCWCLTISSLPTPQCCLYHTRGTRNTKSRAGTPNTTRFPTTPQQQPTP